MSDPIWHDIETMLLRVWSMRHNEIFLATQGMTPQQKVALEISKIQSGIAGVPDEETLRGPMLVLRVVGGRSDRVYSGEWWFDGGVMDTLEHAYSRIFFSSSDKKSAIRAILRELLAISKEWNTIAEVFALALPSGEHLTAFSGPGKPQQLFANLPLTAEGNRLLEGKLRQHYIVPTWNPLWITKHRQLG